MKKLCKEAGVSEKKVFPHNLRHLFARTYYTLQKDIVRLADILGIKNVRPFGEGDLGRIGEIEESMDIQDFAYRVKQLCGSDIVRYTDGFSDVKTVALVGGDGKGYVKAAIEEGADTYISGRIGYNVMEEAPEMGINLIEAGHYFTEQHITEFFRELLIDFDPNLYGEIADSNMIYHPIIF